MSSPHVVERVFRVAAVALVASIPPLATVLFERWATRTGRLG